VYMHKTVLSAEYMLIHILKRAKDLSRSGVVFPATKPLQYFLQNEIGKDDFISKEEPLQQFALLDDFDIFSAIKMWMGHSDRVLSHLCERLVNRRLFKIEISREQFSETRMAQLRKNVAGKYGLTDEEAAYFVFTDEAINSAYNVHDDNINIRYKDGALQDIALASDQMNINVLSKPVVKYFLCYPKDIKS
jgi:uncharacterized protein